MMTEHKEDENGKPEEDSEASTDLEEPFSTDRNTSVNKCTSTDKIKMHHKSISAVTTTRSMKTQATYKGPSKGKQLDSTLSIHILQTVGYMVV